MIEPLENSTNRNDLQKPPDERAKSGFVGLKNQGATCYLNSLIQAMYMTPELRKGLYSIDPKELGADEIDDYEMQKAADEKKGDIEVNEDILNQLISIGFSEIGSRKSLTATKNACFFDALEYYQLNESDPAFNTPVRLEENKKKKKKPRFIPIELQKLFTKLQLLNEKSISTEELTSKGFQWQGMDGRVQHDAHELNRLLIDALEKSLKNTSGELLPKTLYQGTLSNQIRCENCNRISERLENFYDLNVQVDGCPDIAHALRQYTSAEYMEGESAYACEICSSKQNALRFTTIKSLPPILTISCNRFKCDRTTNWLREKIVSRSAFPLLIDMSDFKQGSPIAGKPMTLSENSKERVEDDDITILRRKMIWIDDVWEIAQQNASALIDKYGVDISLDSLTPDELTDIEISVCGVKVFCNKLSPDSEHEIYQLSAVIMHRGSAHSGHYFAYIRDSEKQGVWQVSDTDYLQKFHLTESDVKTDQAYNDTPYDKQYFISNTGVIYIDESSVLRKVILVFQSCPNASILAQTLGKTIKSNLGCSWNDMYKDEYGTLNEFLKAFPIIFCYNSETNTVSLRKSELMRYLNNNDFNIALEKENKEGNEIPSLFVDNAATTTSEIQQPPVAHDDDGDEWTSTTKSKKSKNKSKIKAQASNKSADSNDIHKPVLISADDYIKHSAKARMSKYSICKLASEILNRFHGVYFEFNDSEVTPLPLSCLRQAFQGADSAYILVYKKVISDSSSSSAAAEEMDNVSIVSECSTSTSTVKTKCKKAKIKIGCSAIGNIPENYTTVSDIISIVEDETSLRSDARDTKPVPLSYKGLYSSQVSPPPFWSQKVDSRNRELSDLRVLLNKISSEVTLKVLFSENTVCNKTLFNLKPGVQPNCIPCYLFVVDIKVSEVVQTLNDYVASNASVISEVYNCGNGYFGKPWKKELSLADVMEEIKTVHKDSCMTVLLWDGESVMCGDANFPLKITVTYLARTKEELDTVQLNIHRSMEVETSGLSLKFVLWINRSELISEMCAHISEVLKLDISDVCIHLINTKQPSNAVCMQNTTSRGSILPHAGVGSRTRSVAGTNGSKPTTKGMEPMLLCKSGMFNDFAMPGLPAACKTDSSTPKRVYSKSSKSETKKKNDDQNYNVESLVLVGEELLVERVINSKDEYLAVNEIKHRNVTFEIEVSVEFSVQQLRALLESDEQVTIDLTGSNEQIFTSATSNTETEITLPSVLKLDYDQNSSMLNFKNEILLKLGIRADVYAQLIQFRLGSFAGENIIDNENLSLLDIGLHDGAIIILELAEANTKKCLLNVIRVTGNNTGYKYTPSASEIKTNPFEIRVRANTTMCKLKETIVSRIGCTTSSSVEVTPKPVEDQSFNGTSLPSHRLRAASARFAEPADLIAEFDDKGKAVTVESVGLSDGDTVYFEEGEPPKHGTIYFSVYLWQSAQIGATEQFSGSHVETVDDCEAFDEKTLSHQRFEALENSRKSHLLPVGEVSCKEEENLSRLQELVFAKLSSSSSASSVNDVNHFLLRELRADLLPGQCWWTCNPPKTVHTNLDLTNIGKPTTAGASSKPAGSIAIGGTTLLSTLKKLSNASSGKNKTHMNLVVVVLDKPQESVRPSTSGAFNVWLQKLTNPTVSEEGMSVMDPEWPPLEFIVGLGDNPNLAHLKGFISKNLHLSSNSTQIYKLEVKSHTWSLFNPKKNEFIKKYIKEGDLLCAFDEDTINSSKMAAAVNNLHPNNTTSTRLSRTATGQQQNVVIVSRFEDKYLLERAKEKKSITKKELSVKRALGAPRGLGNGTKKRIVEIPLTLGGDLNFSDDEDDGSTAASIN